jgi:RNA recognition motif-containing protein
MSSDENVDWSKSISSLLKSSDVREVKKLRKMVLLSLQMDESDKAVKKQFKRAIQKLEEDGVLSLDADGTISVKEKKKRKLEKEKKDKKKKKRKKDSEDAEENEEADGTKEDSTEQEKKTEEESPDAAREELFGGDKSKSKNKPCKGNPQGVTRMFLGNLPFTVDESSLGAFLPGEVTHIKWITDKETGKFYGSAFVEMDSSTSAADAVAMAGEKLIGRALKINFAPAREGDVWPPVKKVVSGGGQAGGSGVKAMSAKPENCLKLFIGNLSYEIDDEAITKFFAGVDAELKAVRWLHHQDTNDFKGW